MTSVSSLDRAHRVPSRTGLPEGHTAKPYSTAFEGKVLEAKANSRTGGRPVLGVPKIPSRFSGPPRGAHGTQCRVTQLWVVTGKGHMSPNEAWIRAWQAVHQGNSRDPRWPGCLRSQSRPLPGPRTHLQLPGGGQVVSLHHVCPV